MSSNEPVSGAEMFSQPVSLSTKAELFSCIAHIHVYAGWNIKANIKTKN